jgi:hypothetical protein
VPTHEEAEAFRRQFDALSPEQKAAFRRAIGKFVEDLRRDGDFRPGLRVRAVQALPGCFELTWAGDGRAIWAYGPEVRDGERHVRWIAVGTHTILP